MLSRPRSLGYDCGTMKRLIFPLIFTLFLLAAPLSAPLRANAAAEQYAVAHTPTVWFYSAEDEDARLFLLPYTYCVKVLYRGETFTEVEYLTDDAPYRAIHGYCRTDSLQFADFIPERPYLRREITVSYTLTQGGSLGSGAFGSVERTFVYYGHRYEGAQLYFYVLSEDGVFDYIPMEQELEYELNEDYLRNPATVGGSADNGGISTAAVVAVCVACGISAAIAILVLRGKKPALPEAEQADF